ncbi:hypothetical protein [Apilactobacillus micheneri]|uniref:hypothetical protein n=1 Tax=Apilactobacillus micheneri TaxID=1899430 RepID=UPI000D030575|nr:hypothetical protein [Apilactobacillus micheneri]
MEDFNNIPFIIRELNRLNHFQVVCGVLNIPTGKDEDYLEMIAMVNENGADIVPKRTKYLTIPTPNAGKHKASDFDGLFFYITKSGKKSLAMKDGGSIKVMFLLSTHVKIPKRPFFRSSFDNKVNTDWADAINGDVDKIMACQMTAKELYQHLGRLMVNEVQAQISTMTNPGNAPITKANKGKDDPLKDTGTLYRSIGYEVISNAKTL